MKEKQPENHTLESTAATWRIVAGLAIVFTVVSGSRPQEYPHVWRPEYDQPSAGRYLRKLATAEEDFFIVHHRYARRAEELATVTLPKDWRATIVAGSTRRYRVRLDAPTDWPDGHVCWVWGQRVDPATIEPFEINCLTPESTPLD